MKQFLLILAVMLSIAVFSSCRKCYECSIICHSCYLADSLVNNLCSDSLPDLSIYDERVAELDSAGLDCRPLNKDAEKYCIHESEDQRYALYYANRQCVAQ